jgi:hypothetical protein
MTIPIGIMSALALARDGFGFKLLPWLDAVITAYGILFDDLFLDIVLVSFEPLFALLKNWFDLNWNLYPHWKHGFVLLWLFFAAWERTALKPDAVQRWRDVPLWIWFFVAIGWISAGLIALVAGVLSGTVPLEHPAVLWWPMAGFGLFIAGAGARQDWLASRRDRKPWASALGITALFIVIGSALMALPMISNSRSPGLATLAILIGSLGVLSLLVGTLFPEGEGNTFWQKWLGGRSMLLGLDVLAVLGSAAIIVWIAQQFA